MNGKWQEFLHGEGAVLENGTITHFAGVNDQMRLESGATCLTALTDLGVVRISGDDAGTFLQAHFCNDVSALADGEAQLSGYCSPKGRLLAVFSLLYQSDDYWLLMPRELIESVVKRLNMFAMMVRPAGKQMVGKAVKTAAQLSDVSDEYMVVGLESAELAELIKPSATATFAVPGKAVEPQRFVSIAPFEEAVEIWSQLTLSSVPCTNEPWRLANIRAGIPEIVQATQELFVPQMANLHLLDGVSFTKGCYPGQEIVARMQYLGTLKRRMERFRVAADGVQPGTALCSAQDQSAGVVVQAAATEEEGISELLAVIKISAANEALLLGSTTGSALERLDLPYDFQASAESA